MLEESRMYFVRLTHNPEADLMRGFSGFEGSWFHTKEDAEACQASKPEGFGAIRQDPVNGMWCADPEWGLSAFGFHDAPTLERALSRIAFYWDGVEKIAVFESDNFLLQSGADGEDCFREGRHLGWMPGDGSWADFEMVLQNNLSEKPNR